MTQHKLAFSFPWIAALLIATPAVGQLLNHPVQALPVGDAAGTTHFFGAQWARGLNDDSGKDNSFAAGVGRAMERVSFMAMGGYVASDLDELTLGANVAVHLLSGDGTPVQVSVQGGFGWVKFDDPETVTSFPIGVALQGRPSGNATTITPWVMPRLDIQHSSQFSSTETNFGAAAGLSVNSEGGAGAHLAIDWVHTDFFDPIRFAIGVHRMVGN